MKVSRVWQLGRSLLQAKEFNAKDETKNPLKILEESEGTQLIFTGRISNILIKPEGGYSMSEITIEGLNEFSDSRMFINQEQCFLKRASQDCRNKKILRQAEFKMKLQETKNFMIIAISCVCVCFLFSY